jgi:hypothetical protein
MTSYFVIAVLYYKYIKQFIEMTHSTLLYYYIIYAQRYDKPIDYLKSINEYKQIINR